MIFPISHERMSARRWPIVTTILLLLCVAVQIALSFRGAEDTHLQDEAAAQASQYFAEHPYLDVKPDVIPELRDLIAVPA